MTWRETSIPKQVNTSRASSDVVQFGSFWTKSHIIWTASSVNLGFRQPFLAGASDSPARFLATQRFNEALPMSIEAETWS